jgi:hypothetical protein
MLVAVQLSVPGSYLPPVTKVGVGVGVGLGVRVGRKNCAPYLTPVVPIGYPPQTIISLLVQTAV